MTDFSDWLNEQLNKKGWKQADLCRASGLSSGALSTALTRNKIGPEVARAIAAGLDLSQAEVFHAAGLITETPSEDYDPNRERWNAMYDKMKDDEEMMEVMEKFVEARAKAKKKGKK